MSDSDEDNDYRMTSARQGRLTHGSIRSGGPIEVRPPRVADLDPDHETLPRRISAGLPHSTGMSLNDDGDEEMDSDDTDELTDGLGTRSSRTGLKSLNPTKMKGHSRSSLMSTGLSSHRLPSMDTRPYSYVAPSQHHRSYQSSPHTNPIKEMIQFIAPNDIIDDDDEHGTEKNSEFEMRYTPVQCDANHFGSNYSLRTIANERHIKMFIVVTMYNEDADELKRTLKGIMRNIDTLTEEYGDNAWKDICMCIVADGRHKADKGALDYLQELRIFDANQMHSALDHSPNIRLHLFESTLLLPSEHMNGPAHPLQTIFALKERNGGKLDSHHWFFSAFSVQIRPKYCFMVDVGTKPEHGSIMQLYHAMEHDPLIGGCCGEITTRVTASINPFIAAQQFEYKIANILDKSMESVFGFISVLPGAFSAYRFEAIEGEPLNQYFKQISTDIVQISPFKGNMYLAEDRILCFEVLAEKNCAWTLRYVKDAKAATDVPESLTDLIKQRRRWLNGSLFAMIYAISNFREFVENSAHSRLRKLFVSFQFTFFSLNIALQWFLLANFYLMFEFAVLANNGGAGSQDLAVKVFRALFLILTLIQCVAGLGNRPDELPMIYFVCAFGYGVFFTYVLGVNAQLLFTIQGTSQVTNPDGTITVVDQSRDQLYAQIASLCGIAVYFAAGLLHGQLFSVAVSIIQYFFMMPMFLIGFPIYSYCNIHDISWGTKGLETSDMAEGATRKQKEIHAAVLAKRKADLEGVDARFRTFRSNMVIGWLASNALYYQLIFSLKQFKITYIYATYAIFFGLNVFKLFFCAVYCIQGWVRTMCKSNNKKRKSMPQQNSVPINPIPVHPEGDLIA